MNAKNLKNLSEAQLRKLVAGLLVGADVETTGSQSTKRRAAKASKKGTARTKNATQSGGSDSHSGASKKRKQPKALLKKWEGKNSGDKMSSIGLHSYTSADGEERIGTDRISFRAGDYATAVRKSLAIYRLAKQLHEKNGN